MASLKSLFPANRKVRTPYHLTERESLLLQALINLCEEDGVIRLRNGDWFDIQEEIPYVQSMESWVQSMMGANCSLFGCARSQQSRK